MASKRNIRFNHRVERVVVVAAGPLDRRGRTQRGRGDDRNRPFSPAVSCSRAAAITITKTAIRQIPGAKDFGPHRASAEMTRPGLERGKLVVVIGSGATADDPGAGNGEEGRACHHAAAFADLCGVASGAGPGRRTESAGRQLQTRLSSDPLAQRVVGDVFLPAFPSKPERVKQLILQAAFRMALEQDLISAPISPRFQIPGISGSARTDGDLFNAIREKRASVVTSQIDTFTAKGVRLQDGGVSRPTSSSPPPRTRTPSRRPRGQRRRPHGRFCARLELQGHDVFRRAEPSRWRSVTPTRHEAEMRPDLRNMSSA